MAEANSSDGIGVTLPSKQYRLKALTSSAPSLYPMPRNSSLASGNPAAFNASLKLTFSPSV